MPDNHKINFFASYLAQAGIWKRPAGATQVIEKPLHQRYQIPRFTSINQLRLEKWIKTPLVFLLAEWSTSKPSASTSSNTRAMRKSPCAIRDGNGKFARFRSFLILYTSERGASWEHRRISSLIFKRRCWKSGEYNRCHDGYSARHASIVKVGNHYGRRLEK